MGNFSISRNGNVAGVTGGAVAYRAETDGQNSADHAVFKTLYSSNGSSKYLAPVPVLNPDKVATHQEPDSSDKPRLEQPNVIPDPLHPEKYQGSPLQQAESLADHWDEWDMHDGQQFTQPPIGASDDEKETFKFFADNPTLVHAMKVQNGHKDSDPLTKKDVTKFIETAKGDANSVLPKIMEHGKGEATRDGASDPWDGLTGLSDAQKKELSQPIDDAKTLVANWHAWGLGDGLDFSHPPSDLPQWAQDVIKRVGGDGAFSDAVSSKDGSAPNQTVTKDEVLGFIKTATDDAKKASAAYADWAKKNPDASDSAKAFAQSAAIIGGNLTLLTAASKDPNRKVDGNVTLQDLADAADPSSGLSKTLADAAKLWSSPGVFDLVDVAAEDPLTTTPDKIATGGDFEAFLKSKAVPTDDTSLAGALTDAATKQTYLDVDTSKVGKDLFKQDADGTWSVNPDSHYTAKEKAAVLAQLNKAYGSLNFAHDSIDNSTLQQKGINPNVDKLNPELTGKIQALSGDTDVVNLFKTEGKNNLTSFVDADGSLKSALQAAGKAFESGDTLKKLIETGKGPDGKPISIADALDAFTTQGAFYQKILHGDGQPSIDLNEILHKSGQYDKVLQSYKDDYVSGKELEAKIKKVKDQQADSKDPNLDNKAITFAAAALGGETLNYSAVLDGNDVQASQDDFQSNYRAVIEEHKLKSTDTKAFLELFGAKDSGGAYQFDAEKTKSIIEALPEGAITDDQGKAMTAQAVVEAVSDVYNGVRLLGGSTWQAYIDLKGQGERGNPILRQQFKGNLLVGTTLLTMALLGADVAEGQFAGKQTPQQIARYIADGGLVLGISAFTYQVKKGAAGRDAEVERLYNEGFQRNQELYRNIIDARGRIDANERRIASLNNELNINRGERTFLEGANSTGRLGRAKNDALAELDASDNRLRNDINEANAAIAEDNRQIEQFQQDRGTIESSLKAAKLERVYKNGGIGLNKTPEDLAREMGEKWTGFGSKGVFTFAFTMTGAPTAVFGGLSIDAGVEALRHGDKVGAGLNIGSGIITGASGVAFVAEAAWSALGAAGSELGPTVGAFTAFDLVAEGAIGAAGLIALAPVIYELVKVQNKQNAEIHHTTDQAVSTLEQFGITGGPLTDKDELYPDNKDDTRNIANS